MLSIRPMTLGDAPFGMRLKEEAGWNQTEADWQRFLELEPDGCFVAEWDGMSVGTTTTCTFGPIAWIAMVLVDTAYRGRGIGTALMQHAVDHLDFRGIRGVRLDATPLGRPVYEKLGFTADYLLDRYQGILPGGPAVPGVETAAAVDLPTLAELDCTVTGTDRHKLLGRLLEESCVRLVRCKGQLKGFLMTRPGSRALQLGPCVAIHAEAGAQLFADARHRMGGSLVYVDVPQDNVTAAGLVRAAGLTVQRAFLRMGRGARPAECQESLWASSGPEKG